MNPRSGRSLFFFLFTLSFGAPGAAWCAALPSSGNGYTIQLEGEYGAALPTYYRDGVTYVFRLLVAEDGRVAAFLLDLAIETG